MHLNIFFNDVYIYIDRWIFLDEVYGNYDQKFLKLSFSKANEINTSF